MNYIISEIKNFSDIFLLFIYLNSFNFKPRLYGLLFMNIFQKDIINMTWKLPNINFQVF